MFGARGGPFAELGQSALFGFGLATIVVGAIGAWACAGAWPGSRRSSSRCRPARWSRRSRCRGAAASRGALFYLAHSAVDRGRAVPRRRRDRRAARRGARPAASQGRRRPRRALWGSALPRARRSRSRAFRRCPGSSASSRCWRARVGGAGGAVVLGRGAGDQPHRDDCAGARGQHRVLGHAGAATGRCASRRSRASVRRSCCCSPTASRWCSSPGPRSASPRPRPGSSRRPARTSTPCWGRARRATAGRAHR